jgi:transcriptional regulator with XRE-family HTH domain
LSEEEKAHAIKKLIELKNITQKEAASLLGITDSYIHQLLAFLEAPKEIFFLKYISKWHI